MACVFIGIAALGCGGGDVELAPVKGKVLLDGQPLTTGWVHTFPSSGRGAQATIQSDGSFELSTFGDGDGAVPGTHKAVVGARAPRTGVGSESPQGKLLVPAKYTNEYETTLTIEVKADGDNSPVLELKSK